MGLLTPKYTFHTNDMFLLLSVLQLRKRYADLKHLAPGSTEQCLRQAFVDSEPASARPFQMEVPALPIVMPSQNVAWAPHLERLPVL